MLKQEGYYSELIQKSIMKLLFIWDDITLYPVTILRKVRRWYNAVTEIYVSIDPEFLRGDFLKKVKAMHQL